MKIVFDIGGSNTRAGLFSDDGKLVAKRTEATLQEYPKGIARIAWLARQLSPSSTPDRVAVVIAGVLDRDEGTILVSPNLSGWEGKPPARDLSSALGLPVLLENDAVPRV